MPFEKASMAVMIVMVCISITFNFVDLAMAGSGITTNADQNMASVSNSSVQNSLNKINSDFNKSVSSGASLDTLTYGISAVIQLTFFTIGAVVATPLNIAALFNKVAFLLETDTAGPIHILFGTALFAISLIMLWGAFAIVREIARIIRGA